MDNKNSMVQLRYLEEVTINLRRAGFEVGRIEDQHLPVNWNGSYLCRVSGRGNVLYQQNIVDALGAQTNIQYETLLGYKKGLDGRPAIVPEEAETVRRIYERYLAGKPSKRNGTRRAKEYQWCSNMDDHTSAKHPLR